MRTLLVPAVMTLAFAPAFAAERGTPEEAQAMLARAVEAIRADEPAALAAFMSGDPQFRDKDLYVICGGEDGIVTANGAHPATIGRNLREYLDKGGRPFGAEMYRVAVEGEVHTVEYAQARPGEIAPSRKVAYVTRVADQVCGVGYFK